MRLVVDLTRCQGYGQCVFAAPEPYDRVALSKQVLTGSVSVERTALPRIDGLDADWRLGEPAVGLDRRNKRVLLRGGEQVAFDRLLIATGARARAWPNPEEAALDGVYTVRSRDDVTRLRQKLAEGPRRVLVIGAGFIGSELASDCRELGLPVTVVERGPAPLAGALGAVIGQIPTAVPHLGCVRGDKHSPAAGARRDTDGTGSLG